jgi:hypothetical protein
MVTSDGLPKQPDQQEQQAANESSRRITASLPVLCGRVRTMGNPELSVRLSD